MGTTLVTLRDDLIKMMGNRTELTADATRWIQQAYRLTTQNVQFRPRAAYGSSTRVTVAGVPNYGLPTDIFSIDGIRNDTHAKVLGYMAPQQYDAQDATYPAPPTRYTLRGSTLYLWPTPDAAYTLTLHYWKVLTLPSDSSESVLDESWDAYILDIAASIAFARVDEPDRALRHRALARDFARTKAHELSLDNLANDSAMSVVGGEVPISGT